MTALVSYRATQSMHGLDPPPLPACAGAGINWIKEGDNWPADDPRNRGIPVPSGYPSHFSGNFWWAKAAFWHTLPDGFLGAQA